MMNRTMLLDNIESRSIVNGFRGLGIALVICFHVVVGVSTLLDAEALRQYIAALPDAMNIMWQALGSELVFLFSGFLLSYLLMREQLKTGRIDVYDFYIRRFSRIVPMYILALLVYSFVSDFSTIELVLNVLFISKLFDAETIIPVGWSLEVLVQYYVVLPWLLLALLRSGRPVLICVIGLVLCIGARYLALASDSASYQMLIYELIEGASTTETQDKLYYLIWYRFAPFLLGFLMAYLVVHDDAAVRRFFKLRARQVTALVMALVLIAVSGFLPIQDRGSVLYAIVDERFWLWFWTLQRFVFSVGICVLALCLWYGRMRLFVPIRWLVGSRVWEQLSTNIYGIYLFHPVFLIPAAVVGLRATRVENIGAIHALEILLIIVLTAVAATFLSQLLARFVEIPLQGRIRAWLRQQ